MRKALAAMILLAATPAAADWQGFYAGAHVGYGFSGNIGSSGWLNNWDRTPRGVIGGLQVGYDWQFGRFVLGVTGDANLSSIGRFRRSDPALIGLVTNMSERARLNYSASIRARVGFLPVDRLLLYVTGGPVVAQTMRTWLLDLGVRTDGETRTATQYGGTVGLGAEAMITDKISATIEWRYTALRPYLFGPDDSFSFQGQDVRLGVNYRF
ncbi:MAG: porin family protein [Rhizobiales bacterium]|nr:porin family protein [Hyphomicrobiales bacterium]